jgi:N-acetylmuramic acid 6-phosphate (MurNAc-6-P) etherase
MEEKEEKTMNNTSEKSVKIINTVKTMTNGGKDPYVLKAMARAKDRLRHRLIEINGG